MAEAPPPGWEGILAPGETILWQGRPVARFDWALIWGKSSVGGLLFTGFSLFWILQALAMTRSGPEAGLIGYLFPFFGIPFLLVGLNGLLGTPWRAYQRLRATHYTLTDRNAFIATAVGGKRELENYSLTNGMKPTLEDGEPGSVWFAQRMAPQSRWFGSGAAGAYGAETERVGFQSIPDARRVFRLMLDAQSALASAARAQDLHPAQAAAPPPAPEDRRLDF